MSDINILSPHVADLIAAGEVVERPASVIKELIENSMDAGARSITAEFKAGGMTHIRVTDDGKGMSPEDAGIAFTRHATSKLSAKEDLDAIGSFGFRGEALAAIAAVSRIELLTRQRGAETGTRLTLEAGDIIELSPAGCPEGTTIIVRDLFYNTPARLKFMKSDRAESGACIGAALRCAMGRPDVSLRLVRDGREEFFSPGDSRTDSCVYGLLGRDIATSFLEACSEDEGVTVHGFVGSPNAGRGNRSCQYFFCNGRSIKSQHLQAALEQAYKNSLLTGRFPTCVLYLEINPACVDVNVHPTKAEVKFSEEKRVFDAVYYAAKGALQRESGTPQISISPGTRAAAKPRDDFFKSMPAGEFRSGGSGGSTSPVYTPPDEIRSYKPAPVSQHTPAIRDPGLEIPMAGGRGSYAPPAMRQEAIRYEPRRIPEPVTPVHSEKVSDNAPPFRVVGEALCTYIIAESGNDMVLIDKHAAHERLIFDRLKAGQTDIMSQSLLVPVTFTPGGCDLELILENLPLLDRLGFEIEPYGEDALILRSIPSDTDPGDARAMLEELCRKIVTGGGDAGSVRDGIFHTIACKAAIKAGRSSEPGELGVLAERVLSGEVKYCPHGRPVAVTLTKKELDRQFKRIV